MGSAAVGVPLGLVGAPENKQNGPAKAAADGKVQAVADRATNSAKLSPPKV